MQRVDERDERGEGLKLDPAQIPALFRIGRGNDGEISAQHIGGGRQRAVGIVPPRECRAEPCQNIADLVVERRDQRLRCDKRRFTDPVWIDWEARSAEET